METPITEKTRLKWSGQRSRYTAEITPRGIPKSTASSMAVVVSPKVAGKNARISAPTGRRVNPPGELGRCT